MDVSTAQYLKVSQSLQLQYSGIKIEFSNLQVEISRKTGRIRSIIENDKLLFSLRTSDGRFLPTMDGAQYLLSKGYNGNRVYVNDDSAPYVAEGKSAFCKHIVKCDENIVPEMEVFLLSLNDELLAVGTAVQPGYAMLQLQSGVAVKIKHH